MRRHCVVLAAAVLCVASDAAAQDNGFVRGLFGITFGAAESAPVFAGGGGVNIGSLLQITGEVGRMQDVKTEDVEDRVASLAALLSLSLRTPVTLDVDAPAFYAMGGVRALPTAASIRPFAEVSAGISRISFDVPDVTVAGVDVTRIVRDSLGDDSRNEFLLIGGGGISIDLFDRIAAEAGYRYGRIFTDEPAIDLSTVYGAIALKF